MNKTITFIIDGLSVVNAKPLRGNWDITEPIRCPHCSGIMQVAAIDVIQYGLQWDLHTNFLRCFPCKADYYIRYEIMFAENGDEQ